MDRKPANLLSLARLLQIAQAGGFAVGAFSPRYAPAIRAVLRAAESTRSPVIVQVAQIELKWYNLSLDEFSRQFWSRLAEVRPSVPVGLHLDHTTDFSLIQAAIELGFTSVMIDASGLPLEANVAETRKDAYLSGLPPEELEDALRAVQDVVEEKIERSLGSQGRSDDYSTERRGGA